MKHRDFFNKEHAQSYLVHSIIMLGDMPVRITGVTSGAKGSKNFNLEWESLDRKDSGFVFSNDRDVNMQPVKLGMLAHADKSPATFPYYLSRIPARAWKVGLHSENMKFSPVVDGKKVPMRIDTLPYSTEMINTIRGKFPEYEEALSIAKKENGAKAFSRNFAVNADGELFFHTYGVPIGKNLKLYDKASCLKEVLEQDLR